MQKIYPSVDAILPHRKTMLLIDTLLESCGTKGRVSIVMKENTPYWSENGLKMHWLIEMMAQGVGAVYGYEARKNKAEDHKPNLGFLIALDQFEINANNCVINIGDQLMIDVNRLFDFYPMGLYDVKISHSEKILASANMKFVVAADATFPGGLPSNAF